METQNCKATQFYFGFRGHREHGSTLQVRCKNLPSPKARGPGKVGVQGAGSLDPIRLVGCTRRKVRQKPAMAQIGERGRKKGAEFKNVESGGWFSSLH